MGGPPRRGGVSSEHRTEVLIVAGLATAAARQVTDSAFGGAPDAVTVEHDLSLMGEGVVRRRLRH